MLLDEHGDLILRDALDTRRLLARLARQRGACP